MNKTLGIAIFALIIVCICVSLNYMNNQKKGGKGTGLFEKNSDSITVYVNNEKYKTYKDDAKSKIIKHMKNLKTVSDTDIKFDNSFTIKIDCNNEIGIMYLREQDTVVFLRDKSKPYKLSQEDYDYIISYVN